MSGLGAPSFTTTPTPTLASFTWLPAASLPLAIISSTTAGVITKRSKASPPSIRFFNWPVVPLSTVTLWPVCFSKSGTSASTTGL